MAGTKKVGKYKLPKSQYADPGFQDDKEPRYPLSSAEKVRAAISYISKASNASKYTAEELKKIKAKIRAAAKKFKIETDF